MGSESEEERRKEALLQAAAALATTRDELLACAELLREHQFNTDEVGRRAAVEFSDNLLEKVRASR